MGCTWHKSLQCKPYLLPAGGGDAASAFDPCDCLIAPSSASDYDGDVVDEVTKGKQRAVIEDCTEHTEEYASMLEHIEQDASKPTHNVSNGFLIPVQKQSTYVYFPLAINPDAEISMSGCGAYTVVG